MGHDGPGVRHRRRDLDAALSTGLTTDCHNGSLPAYGEKIEHGSGRVGGSTTGRDMAAARAGIVRDQGDQRAAWLA